MRFLLSLIALWGLVFMSGCAAPAVDVRAPLQTVSSPAAEPLPTSLPDSPAPEATASLTPPRSTAAASGLESLIEKAKQDLARRLSIAITQISLVEAEAVVWPDSSLGCPQPDMLYKQVPEDGALVVLQVKATRYEYHAGGSRGLFLCEKASKDPSPPPRLDPELFTPRPTLDNGIPPGEDT